LKKLKISKSMTQEDMWSHLSPIMIEKLYGGEMEDMNSNFWPPQKKLMTFIDPKVQNSLITISQYK
jgi:hypothetical protein